MNKTDIKKIRERIGPDLTLDVATALELVALAEEALVIRERDASLVAEPLKFQSWWRLF